MQRLGCHRKVTSEGAFHKGGQLMGVHYSLLNYSWSHCMSGFPKQLNISNHDKLDDGVTRDLDPKGEESQLVQLAPKHRSSNQPLSNDSRGRACC